MNWDFWGFVNVLLSWALAWADSWYSRKTLIAMLKCRFPMPSFEIISFHPGKKHRIVIQLISSLEARSHGSVSFLIWNPSFYQDHLSCWTNMFIQVEGWFCKTSINFLSVLHNIRTYSVPFCFLPVQKTPGGILLSPCVYREQPCRMLAVVFNSPVTINQITRVC